MRIVIVGQFLANFVDLNILIEELNTLVDVLFDDVIDVELVLLVLVFEGSIEHDLDDVRDVLRFEIEVSDLNIVSLDRVGLSLLQSVGIDWLHSVGVSDEGEASVPVLPNPGSKIVKIMVILIVIERLMLVLIVLLRLQSIDFITFTDQVDLETGAEDLVDAQLAFLRLGGHLRIRNHFDVSLAEAAEIGLEAGHGTRAATVLPAALLPLPSSLQVSHLFADPILDIQKNRLELVEWIVDAVDAVDDLLGILQGVELVEETELILFKIFLLLLIRVYDLHPKVLRIAAQDLIIVQLFLLIAEDLKLEQRVLAQNIYLVEMLQLFFFQSHVWILSFEFCQDRDDQLFHSKRGELILEHFFKVLNLIVLLQEVLLCFLISWRIVALGNLGLIFICIQHAILLAGLWFRLLIGLQLRRVARDVREFVVLRIRHDEAGRLLHDPRELLPLLDLTSSRATVLTLLHLFDCLRRRTVHRGVLVWRRFHAVGLILAVLVEIAAFLVLLFDNYACSDALSDGLLLLIFHWVGPQEFRLLLRHILQVLQHSDVDCLQRLLHEGLDHVHVLADLVLEHLIDLEQVHLDVHDVAGACLRLHLLLQSLLVSDLVALVDEFGQHDDPLRMQQENVLHILLVFSKFVKADEVLALDNSAILRVPEPESHLHFLVELLQ